MTEAQFTALVQGLRTEASHWFNNAALLELEKLIILAERGARASMALVAAKRTLAAYQEHGAPHTFVGNISLSKVHALIDAVGQPLPSPLDNPPSGRRMAPIDQSAEDFATIQRDMLSAMRQYGWIEVPRWNWPVAEELRKAELATVEPGSCRNTRIVRPKPGALPMSHHPSAPIVGMFFRPPAKAILAVLPADCPLHLEPEPTNAHDPNAIAVMVESRDIPATSRPALEETCPPMGFSADDIFEAPGWHLGYIKRDFAEELAPAFEQLVGARLGFDPAGKPLAILEWRRAPS